MPSVLASLTKGGLQSADQVAGHRVRRARHPGNAVAPGIIKTPMHAEETYATSPACTRSGGWARSSDIVDAVLYLENAPFVTGEILHVDGGQSAGH